MKVALFLDCSDFCGGAERRFSRAYAYLFAKHDISIITTSSSVENLIGSGILNGEEKIITFNENLRLKKYRDFKLWYELKFVFSNHIGVIVHWENNDVIKKGGTWQYSLNWAKNSRQRFTTKAYNYLILNHVVYPQLKEKKRWSGTKVLLQNVSLEKIGLKEWYFAISNFLFGKIIIPWKK